MSYTNNNVEPIVKRCRGRPKKIVTIEMLLEVENRPKKKLGRPLKSIGDEEKRKSMCANANTYYKLHKKEVRIKSLLSRRPDLIVDTEFMKALNNYTIDEQYELLLGDKVKRIILKL